MTTTATAPDERALREREKALVSAYPNVALAELAIALQLRGIDPGLARTVAHQIAEAEPIEGNIRVKYGITESTAARPSAAALAAISVPITPLAPARFSTKTCRPQTSARLYPRTRATMSVPPPAGKATMMCTGFAGKLCPGAGPLTDAAHRAAAQTINIGIDTRFIASSA